MQAYEAALSELLSKLDSRRHDKASIDQLVAEAIASPSLQHHASSENWKPHWEYAVRNAIFNLAVRRLSYSRVFWGLEGLIA